MAWCNPPVVQPCETNYLSFPPVDDKEACSPSGSSMLNPPQEGPPLLNSRYALKQAQHVTITANSRALGDIHKRELDWHQRVTANPNVIANLQQKHAGVDGRQMNVYYSVPPEVLSQSQPAPTVEQSYQPLPSEPFSFSHQAPPLRHLPPRAIIPQSDFRENFPPLQYQHSSNDAKAFERREAELRKLALHYVREAHKDKVRPNGIFRDPDETSVDGSDTEYPNGLRTPPLGSSQNRSPNIPPNAACWLNQVTEASMIENLDAIPLMNVIAYTDLLSTLMKLYPRSTDKDGLRSDIEMLECARGKRIRNWLDGLSGTLKEPVKRKKGDPIGAEVESVKESGTARPLRKRVRKGKNNDGLVFVENSARRQGENKVGNSDSEE